MEGRRRERRWEERKGRGPEPPHTCLATGLNMKDKDCFTTNEERDLGVIMSSNLKSSSQCQCYLYLTSLGILHSVMVAPSLVKNLFENDQRRATDLVYGLQNEKYGHLKLCFTAQYSSSSKPVSKLLNRSSGYPLTPGWKRWFFKVLVF